MRFFAVLAPLLALACVPSHARELGAAPRNTAASTTTAAAAAASAATRAVSAAEMASFADSLRLLAPGAYVSTPVFAAERAPTARAWTVSATVDSAAEHGASRLCHMRRTRFVLQPQAFAAQRWRIDASSALAWPSGAGACVVPAHPLVLLQPVPDTDVLAAYAKLTPLLQRARLLMAGNSSCAHLRSVNFRLAGMGVSAPPQGAEQMQVLRFESDHAADAQVWIRRTGLELEAWNVACAPL